MKTTIKLCPADKQLLLDCLSYVQVFRLVPRETRLSKGARRLYEIIVSSKGGDK